MAAFCVCGHDLWGHQPDRCTATLPDRCSCRGPREATRSIELRHLSVAALAALAALNARPAA